MLYVLVGCWLASGIIKRKARFPVQKGISPHRATLRSRAGMVRDSSRFEKNPKGTSEINRFRLIVLG